MGAAPMLAATIYMSLKRIVNALDASDYSPISLRWISKLFVLFDVACFVSQIAGSAMRADVSSASTGTALVMVGLITQVVIFFIYISLMASIHFRLNRNPTNASNHPDLMWRHSLWSLYFVSAAFLIRNFVRIVEFKGGDNGILIREEWPLYLFDGGFMLAITVMMVVVHPGRLVRKVDKMRRASKLDNNNTDDAMEAFRPLVGQN